MTTNEMISAILSQFPGSAMVRRSKANFIAVPMGENEDGVMTYAKVAVSALLSKDTKTNAAFNLETAVAEQLQAVHDGMYERAKKNLEDHIYEAHSLEEAKELQEKNGGFIKTMWCGELDCELKMKEVAGMSSRCMPFAQENLGDVCPICGKPAKTMIYWGVAY